MDVFGRLSAYIQDYLYANNWTELREVQVAACDIIFNTADNLLLVAGTASGKTEAAFLPALTVLDENPSQSVGILYISPLKALINDQFVRLDSLLAAGNVSVCKWHGDVSDSAKNKLLKKPQGVLQITPESLESLLMNRREACIRLFRDLRFVIIDEIHYFMASARGLQLLCQLERLQRLTGCVPRRIGLSATLSDYLPAEEWLNSGTGRGCRTPVVNAGKRKLYISMQRFELENPEKTKEAEKTPDPGKNRHIDYLYRQTLNKKAIIFAKSRAEVENVIVAVRQKAEKERTKDTYRVHHGSISTYLREKAERDMKDSEQSIVTGATVTLELGMDIGTLDMVVQIGSPFSASSFTQRIGRCGRRGQTAELLFTFEEYTADENGDPIRRINWDFIKTIAILQLYLEERWVEPIMPNRHPYGILYHQTMSWLVSAGEAAPAILAQNILSLSVFKHISQEDYRILLQHLLVTGHLEKTEQGGLIIGRMAERMINHYSFFSVFEVPVEYLVKEGNQTIGTVMEAYPVGVRFALAGHAWETTDLDEKSKTLFVKAVNGVSKISWVNPAEADTHTHLLEKMRSILLSSELYAYLSQDCQKRLILMRELAVKAGILINPVVSLDDHKFAVFPWLGTRQMAVLFYALQQKGIACTMQPGGLTVVYLEAAFDGSEDMLKEVVLGLMRSEIDKERLILPERVQIPNKYNDFVPSELLRKQFLEDYLDSRGITPD